MYNKSIKLKLVNLETDPIPHKDNFFDVVFSKSVLEHFYKPELLVKEMHRVLKPGGTIITLCPDCIIIIEFILKIIHIEHHL